MRGRLAKIAGMIGVLMLSAPALAEESLAQTDFDGVGNLFSVVMSLAVVLAVVFAVAWFLRRLQGFTSPRGQMMRVVAQMPVTHRERILLVEVGREQLVVGVGPGGMRTLHVLEERLEPEAPSPSNGVSFRERLLESLGRGGPQQ